MAYSVYSDDVYDDFDEAEEYNEEEDEEVCPECGKYWEECDCYPEDMMEDWD